MFKDVWDLVLSWRVSWSQFRSECELQGTNEKQERLPWATPLLGSGAWTLEGGHGLIFILPTCSFFQDTISDMKTASVKAA